MRIPDSQVLRMEGESLALFLKAEFSVSVKCMHIASGTQSPFSRMPVSLTAALVHRNVEERAEAKP